MSIDWQETLGLKSQPQTSPKSATQQIPKKDWSNVVGQQPKTVYHGGIEDAEFQSRGQRAAKIFGANGFNVLGTPEAAMAAADMFFVGVPTFGEKPLTYEGRDELKKLVLAEKTFPEAGVRAYIQKYFGKEALNQYLGFTSELTAPFQERFKGTAIPEAFIFQEALGRLPELMRGQAYLLGRQIPMVLTGNPDAKNWRDNLESIEADAKNTPVTRAADGASRVLQYFVPYIGQATAFSDFSHVADRQTEVGLPNAIGEEIIGTLQGVNVFEPGLGWDERLVRGLGLAVLAHGVSHGVRAAADTLGFIKGSPDPFGFGKVMGEALEMSMREDPMLAAMLEGRQTRAVAQSAKDPAKGIEAVDRAAASAPRKYEDAIKTVIAQGGDQAAFWTAVQARHSQEPNRSILDIAREESTKPEWQHLTDKQTTGEDSAEAPFKEALKNNIGFIKQINRANAVSGPDGQPPKLEAGQEAIWKGPDGDQPVKLLGRMGTKDGQTYWAIEGTDTGIPEAELIPQFDTIKGRNVTETDIALARNRAVPKSEAIDDPRAPLRKVGSGEQLAKVLYDNFGFSPKDSDAIGMVYQARAEAWAAHAGDEPAAWFADRLAGVAAEDAAFTPDDIRHTVKYADELGEIQEGKMITLKDGMAEIRTGDSTSLVPRSAIIEGLPKDRQTILPLEDLATTGAEGKVVISVQHYGKEKMHFELTGKAKESYEVREMEYRKLLSRHHDGGMASEAIMRKAAGEFAAFKRKLTGELTEKERYELTKANGSLEKGARVVTPAGEGISQGGSFGRIRVKLDSDGAVKPFARTDVKLATDTANSQPGVRKLTDAELAAIGRTNDKYARQTPPRGTKGLVDFFENGRAVVRAFRAADLSTFVHELAHIMRREIYLGTEFSASERTAIEQFAGVKDSRWTREAEEKFARGLERYFREEKAPTRALSKAFRRVKAWMKKLYTRLEGGPLDFEIPKEMVAVYDKMFGRDIDKKLLKEERLQQVKDAEKAKVDQAIREQLMEIDPSDPNIDIDDPFHDEALVLQIKNNLGTGPEDYRKPGQIILDAREAEMMADHMESVRRDLDSGTNLWIGFINDEIAPKRKKKGKGDPEKLTNEEVVAIARAKKQSSYDIYAVTKKADGQIIVDYRRPLNTYSIDGWPEDMQQAAINFLQSQYRAPEYFITESGNIKNYKKGDKLQHLYKADEWMMQNEGSKMSVTKDFLEQFKRHLQQNNEYGRLYQTEDYEDSNRGGMSALAFDAKVDEMAFWAAEILDTLDGNIEQAKKLIRKEYGTDALQTLEVLRRIDELMPIERIVQTYQEFGGSYKAITQMLIDEFPDLPKARYGRAVERALRLNGLKQATVPSMRVNPQTKKPEPIPYKSILVVGSEDLLIPADIYDGMTTWAQRTGSIPMAANLGRFLERVAGRDHKIIEWLVGNRQYAVTALTKDLQSYRDRLSDVYGDLINDKDARMHIMFYGEQKGPLVEAERARNLQPVIKEIISHALNDSDAHIIIKRAVVQRGGDWDAFVKQKTLDAYDMVSQLAGDEKVFAIIEEAANALAQNSKTFSLVAKKAGLQNMANLYSQLRSPSREFYTLESLQKARPNDWQKIKEIAEWHREEYDKVFEQVNAVRKRYGLGEIPYRTDYMTHMMEETKTWQRLIGLDPLRSERNPNVKRKSPFNRHALQRHGERSVYDALANFEGYLETSLRQVHLTEPAVRHRAVARTLMRMDLEGGYTDIAKQLDHAADELAMQKKGVDLGQVLGNRRLGQTIENYANWFVGRIAKNTILLNLQTALMQTAQIPIAVAMVGPHSVAQGLKERMAMAMTHGVDPSQASPFLTRRYGYEGHLALDWMERANKMMARPMEFIEENTVRLIWTSAKIHAERAGKTDVEAAKYADKVTERMVGGRAIGEQSPIFRSPIGKVLLQFQYEVSNFNQMLMHDLPYDELAGRPLTRKELLGRAATMAVSIYAANWVYQFMFGRRPLPDVIETLLDMVDVAADPDIEQSRKAALLVARPVGTVVSATAGGSFAGSLLPENRSIMGTGMTRQELFGDTEFGMFSGGAPTATSIQRAMTGDTPAEFAWNLTTLLGLPGGGSQVNKTGAGLKAVFGGGQRDKSGKILFDVEGSDVARAAMFGPYATQSGQNWLRKKREKARR